MEDLDSFEEPKPKYIVRRYLAGFIDYSIVYFITFLLVFILGTPDDEYTYHLNGLPASIPVLFWFLFIVCLETWFGATVGNTIVQLKPVTFSGYSKKISFGQSFKRHLLDPIDMFLFGVIGIVIIKTSDKNQRLGDIWAKTTVTKY